MEKEEKYFGQDPKLIIQIVLNELIDEIELKDSFKEIFNDFNLIMVLPMESSYLILFERLRKTRYHNLSLYEIHVGSK